MLRIIPVLIIVFLSCAEDRAKSFLNHLPKMEEIMFFIPGKDSEDSILNHISRYTLLNEYNSLIADLFIAVQLAEKNSPVAEEGNIIIWKIEGGEYVYQLWVEKKEEIYDFTIEINFSGIYNPTFYPVVNGNANGDFSFTVDLKNLHNFNGSKYPDGETFYVRFHPDGITGFARKFSYFYPVDGDKDAGYIDGTFYFLNMKDGKKCISFTREWDYVKEIPYLYEVIGIDSCWAEDGSGEGRGVISGGEVDKEEEIYECWDNEGRLIFRRTDEKEEGNEENCPFRGGS